MLPVFQGSFAQTVLPRLDDEPALSAAVNRAGADDVTQGFALGLATQLGKTWPGGVEVSFGQ
jgi:ATP-binding cassette subfamily B protein